MLDLIVGTAAAQQGGAPAGPGGGGLQLLLFFGAIIGIWWFLVIRPQSKQAGRHKAMVAALKRGDEVITASGMYGRVAAVEEDSVLLDVGKGVKVKFVKDKVAAKVGSEQSEPEADDQDKKK